MYIHKLSELSKDSTAQAGGKAASLGELINAGIQVPDGFIVTTEAFDDFLSETDLLQEIKSELSDVDKSIIHTIENAANNIQGLILKQDVPENLVAKLLEEFKALGSEYVAVRSSATSEDGKDHAWAGQLDSYLNVTEENLVESIQKCWASLFTPRAIFYRFENGLQDADVSVAVVVQTMVQSKKSGIAFSVHPITEDVNQMVIEAGFGLGEAIVSGQITPDSYVVSKKDTAVIDVNVNKQTKALYKGSEGNDWKELGKEGTDRVLSDDNVSELSKLIVEIEKHYSSPQDIEWAYADGKFYITQSRPITTLSNIKKEARKPLFKINVSRDMALATFEVWVKSDTEKLNDWIGITTERIILENNEGIITAYENEQIFEDAGMALKKLLADKNWLPRKLKEYKENIVLVKKYSDTLIATPSRETFEALFELLATTQGGLAIVYFVPTVEGISEEEKQLCLKERELTEKFFYDANSILESGIALIYPELKEYVNVLSFKEIISGNIPAKAILDERKKYFIYYDGMFHSYSSVTDVEKELVINIEQKVKADSEIRGAIAFSGTAKGPAVIVLRRSDLHKVKTGDVMVCAMTNPDFLPAMHKAIAFVTDEGGITSHAAITAREMKKPCVIGTKIATESIKDGDMIEVNADSGVVKIIKKNLPNPDDFVRMFAGTAFSYLLTDVFLTYYNKWGVASVQDATSWMSLLPKSSQEQTLKDGKELYTDRQKYDLFTKDFSTYISSSVEYLDSILEKSDELSHEEVEKFLTLVANHFTFYSKTEFFYTDLLTEETMAMTIQEFDKLKLDGRSHLNKLIFENKGYVRMLVKKIAEQTKSNEEDLHFYSKKELVTLVSTGIMPLEKVIKNRKIGFFVSKGIELTGKESAALVNDFFAAYREVSDTIRGTTANGGKVTAKARVLRPDWNDFDKISEEIDNMEHGEVLVAETTSPEIIQACKKASAIITNQGGMLSHAAIVSRELNIPCIVGTDKDVVLSIKNGDLLDIDADKGVIKIVKA